MGDLSFASFISNLDGVSRLTKLKKITDLTVIMLYAEYINWLADVTSRFEEDPKITVSELHLQITCICRYYNFLVLEHNKPLALYRNVELLPATELFSSITPPSESFHALPVRNYVTHAMVEKSKTMLRSNIPNALLNGILGFVFLALGLFVLGMAGSSLLGAVMVSLFILPLMFVWATMSISSCVAEVSRVYAGSHLPKFDFLKHLPTMGNKHLPTFLIGYLCGLAVLAAPLPAVALYLLLVPALALPSLAGIMFGFSWFKINESSRRYNLSDELVTQFGDRVKNPSPDANGAQPSNRPIEKTLLSFYATKLICPNSNDQVYDDSDQSVSLEILHKSLRLYAMKR